MQNPKPKPLKEIGNISVGDTYEQTRPTNIRKPTINNYKCFTIKTDEFGKVLTPGVLEKRRRRRKPKPLKEIGNISVGDTYEQPRPTSIRKPKIINYKCFTINTDEFGNGKVLTPSVLEKRRRRRRARFLVFGDM